MSNVAIMKENIYEEIRKKEFGRLGHLVYFDQAGSCLYANSHIQRFNQQLTTNVFGNPHSGNACSEKMSDIIHQTRLDVLRRFNVGVDDYEVIFTSGATDTLKIIGRYFDWNSHSVFAYTEDNHTSVVGIRELASCNGANSYCLKCVGRTLSSCELVKPSNMKIDIENIENDAISLFAFPAQSNFSGAKYPLTWINQVQQNLLSEKFHLHTCANHKWYVLCDAASFVSTSALDLKQYDADFVALSFYKIFGFPTGLGALLVKKSSANVLSQKKYFGGGSVSGWLSSHDYQLPKSSLHDRLEDGTSNFLSILALKLGFDTFSSLGLTINFIQTYTHNLWGKLYHSMKSLCHENGSPVVEFYIDHVDGDVETAFQGPILAFNIKRSDGSFVGYNHVLQLANSNNIYLRGGCFCNIGACTSLIGAHNDVLLKAFGDGHVCGDSIDLVDGKPIGALRISLGPHSSSKDIEVFMNFMSSCFRESNSVDTCHLSHDFQKTSTEVRLENLILYPIKSCQGMHVNEWPVSETGLKYDRMWMIVDEYGSPITLKTSPPLIGIYPEINIEEQILSLKAAGMEAVDVPLIQDSEDTLSKHMKFELQCTSKICGDIVTGYDCGKTVAIWLSEVLGTTCSLIQKSLHSQRYTKKRLNNQGSQQKIALVNEAQVLLINRSSVEYLYGKMVECGYLDDVEKAEMLDNIVKRFRANLIVSGAPAFSEDFWRSISVISTDDQDSTNNTLIKCGLCNRCNVICIDPDTGQKLNGPLRALANISLGSSTVRRKPTFGIYLKSDCSSAILRVHSKVDIQTGVSISK